MVYDVLVVSNGRGFHDELGVVRIKGAGANRRVRPPAWALACYARRVRAQTDRRCACAGNRWSARRPLDCRARRGASHRL